MGRDLSIQKVGKHGCNTTSLNVPNAVNRNVFHRDMLAHWLRYQYVTKCVKRGEDKVLDLGCGEGNCMMAMYANMLGPKEYMGVELRKTLLQKNAETYHPNFPVHWINADLTKEFPESVKTFNPDMITCFEFLEHIPEQEVAPFLERLRNFAARDILISTPVFNGITKADNHVKEWEFNELADVLKKTLGDLYTIEVYGTFISKADFKQVATAEEIRLYEALSEYYNASVLSIMFAPLYPAASRNCLWHLRRIS